jgi:response regulator RpfG family c-di-GMP phosphodiesterase
MDVQMPGMDGFEATGRIREIEAPLGRHTPIAAMTAHAMAGDRARGLAAGMDDYLTKPLQKSDLLALLERVEGGRFAVVPADAPAGPRRHDALQASEASSSSRALPVFSREKLLDQVDGDEELLRRMIELFQENTPRLLDDIRRSIAHGGPDDLASSSHALLSSLGAFGADLAHRLTRQLEARARDENRELNERLFAALECATAGIYPALAKFLAT